jgi:homocitrate synthase NifV
MGLDKVFLVDTTLRDGEQTPFVNFKEKEKLKIAYLLDILGVDEIEAGIPASGDDEKKYFEKLFALSLRAKIFSWNRLSRSDITASIICGVKNVHICVPSSDIHIYKKLKKDKDWIIFKMNKVLDFCTTKDLSVTLGFEDASRADFEFLKVLVSEINKYDVKRVRYADTIGLENPFSVSERIKALKAIWNGEIEYHGHNDLGMATANAFSAFISGASHLSVSVNGLGERAGNTALEEICMAIGKSSPASISIDFAKLGKLSRVVEKYSGVKLSKIKPVVGRDIFTHSSGIHINGMIKDKNTYTSIDPLELGRKNKYVIGKYTGKSAAYYIFKQHGYELAEKQILKALKIIKNIFKKKRTYSQNQKIVR